MRGAASNPTKDMVTLHLKYNSTLLRFPFALLVILGAFPVHPYLYYDRKPWKRIHFSKTTPSCHDTLPVQNIPPWRGLIRGTPPYLDNSTLLVLRGVRCWVSHFNRFPRVDCIRCHEGKRDTAGLYRQVQKNERDSVTPIHTLK